MRFVVSRAAAFHSLKITPRYTVYELYGIGVQLVRVYHSWTQPDYVQSRTAVLYSLARVHTVWLAAMQIS